MINFIELGLGLGAQTSLSDEVPTVFRDLALGASGFDIVQPSIDDGVFLSDTFENWGTGILPLSHSGFEVEWLSHDSVSDSGHDCSGVEDVWSK